VKWLGNNREDIGREKSGIMRSHRPVISGDLNPPSSIYKQSVDKGAILLQAGEQFSWMTGLEFWDLQIDNQQWENLPYPALQGEFQINNAAVAITALIALVSLGQKLTLSDQSIRQGLQQVCLAGRLQIIQSNPEVILDVAHNSHAAKVLVNWLQANPIKGKTYALFSMLDDKDISKVIRTMSPAISHWFVSTVNDPRALSVKELVNKMHNPDMNDLNITSSKTLELAWKKIKKEVKVADRIIVFGSFLVLSEFKVIF
jgi:dihydrofolate synthase/folylpolyglutamate synthase